MLRLMLRVLVLLVLLSVLLVGLFRWVDPPGSAVMVQQRWLADVRVRHEWRDLEAISPQLRLAVIASEDQGFAQHHGLDFDAIQVAVDEYRQGEGLRGASTITQQVARNLFLWQGRSFMRKGLEAYFAVLIDLLWPKRRILEVYLNIAQFGPNMYGAETAARLHFGKAAADLSAAEASAMAVVLPAPSRYSVTAPGEYLRQRAGWVRQQMTQLGGNTYLQRHGLAD